MKLNFNPEKENISSQLLIFFENEKNSFENEVEAKLIFEWKNREEISELHNKLQNKLIEKFSWKLIFDWELEDTRYYDKENKIKSELNDNWIYIVRVRKENWKYLEKNQEEEKYIFTVKKEWENNTAIEYEKEVEDDFWNKLKEKFWLKKIKVSRKKRKEFEIKINNKKVKIAFDEYLPKNNNDSDKYEDNSSVIPYFEVEANDEETRAEAIKQIEKLFPSVKIVVTEWWVKKIKNFESQKKFNNLLENQFWEEYKWSRRYILKMLYQILDYNSIYSEIWDYINNNKKDFEKSEWYKNLEKFLRRIIKKSIKNKIKQNPKNVILFSRILDKDTLNEIYNSIKENKNLDNIGIKFWKKFNDKFEREYPWYIKWFLNSIVNTNIKNENNIDGKKDLIKSFEDKLNNFLSALLLFDDNLTKKELEQFLSKTTPAQKNKFNTFELKISELIKILSINLNQKELDTNIISNFINIYRSWIKWVWFWKNINSSEEWADIIAENLEKTIWNTFSFLVHNFSVWLNVYQTEENSINNFIELKKLFEELVYYTYIFKEIDIFDKNKYWYDFYQSKDFIDKIKKIYKEQLFNNKNFLIPDNEKELFEDFFDNLFKNIDNKEIKNYKNNYFLKYQEELKQILEKIEKNKNENNSVEDSLENLGNKDINYEFWNKLKPDLRIKVFFEKIYFKNDWEDAKFNKDLFKENIEENSDFEEFIEEEFENKYKIKKEKNKEEFNKYFRETKSQFNKAIKIFKSQESFEKLLEYIENNVNDFHLIVSWFHFWLRKKHIEKNKKLQLKDLQLNIPSFEEKVVAKLQEKELILIDWEWNLTWELSKKLITTSSDAYTSIFWNDKLFKRLFNRITNWKDIDLTYNYYITYKNWKKQNLKDINGFYFPKWIDNTKDNFEDVEKYINAWFNIVRKLYNGENIKEKNLSNEEKQYYNFLENCNIDFKEKDYKTLLEFLKFIKKETIYIIEDQHKNSIEDTKFLEEEFKNNNNFKEKIWEWINNFDPENDIIIWWTKSKVGALRKWVWKYWWKYAKIWDKVRMTILWDSEEDLVNLVANFIWEVNNNKKVVGFRFEDNIWNIFKKAKRENWYRDAKLVLELENWNTVEVQFQLKDYYNVKHNWVKIDNKLAKILNPIDSKIEFDNEEKEKIINYYKNTNELIPKDFAKIFLWLKEEDFNKEEYQDIFSDDVKFWADFTYRLERSIWEKSIINKFYEIDRRLFDSYAWWKVAKKELERVIKKK